MAALPEGSRSNRRKLMNLTVCLRPKAAAQSSIIDGIARDVAHNICMIFEYLTVLISVVVGLSVTSFLTNVASVTSFLTNVARIIHIRSDVTISWVQLLWSMTILIWTIAFWWFTFVLAEQPEWTFPLFVFLLAYSTLLFFLMALLFPEGMPADHNYRAQFMRNRVWFFGALLLFLCVDWIDYVVKLEKGVSIVGYLPYAAFVGPLIVMSLFAIRTDNLLFHRIFAVYSLMAVLAVSATTLAPLTS
jgi:hypothetical protein